MAAAVVCIFLLSFLRIFTTSHAEEAPAEPHVAIGPVENITVYFDGPTNIVLAWDPPPVYVIHDLSNVSVDEITPGVEVNATKHHGVPAVSQGNAPDNSTSSAAVTNSTFPEGVVGNFSSENDTMADNTSSTEIWQCKPISFFSNYSVEMKDAIDVNDNHMTVMWKDSSLRYEKQRVTVRENQKIVFFYEGCITHFVVLWQEADNESSVVFQMHVRATSRTANITGLKPATAYKIIVKAVYVSGDEFQNQPPAIFKTKKEEGDKECFCNVLGTVAPSARCNLRGPSYCVCRRGYVGQFCEACVPGYYRAAPHLPCNRCPCSAHATRKSTCKFVEGFLLCDSCEVGYTGNTCHICDKGFYRLSYHCVPCFCNGNTSPDAATMCLPVTGMCETCLHNTTGFNCERCLPGYVGDPVVYKNCTLNEASLNSLKLSSSLLPPEIVVAVFILVVLVVFAGMGFMMFRKYRFRDSQRGLWTIEMDRANEDVNFSTRGQSNAHHGDASSASYFSKHSLTSSPVKYTKLQEQL